MYCPTVQAYVNFSKNLPKGFKIALGTYKVKVKQQKYRHILHSNKYTFVKYLTYVVLAENIIILY